MIKKAVIPSAGLGTRLLPATKSQPKEMLPIVDKPAIHYVIDEAMLSGIENFLIVTGKGKESIENYFDYSLDLEILLKNKGSNNLIDILNEILEKIKIFYVRQKKPKGLGDAIYQAKDYVSNEPFVVLLPDDLFIYKKIPPTKKLIDFYSEKKGIIFGTKRVSKELIPLYGIIKVKNIKEGVYEVLDLIEKPEKDKAPSNLAIVGRYILTPDIFESIEDVKPDKKNEIQLTDAIKNLLGKKKIYAIEIDDLRFDIGDKISYLLTNVIFGIRDNKIGKKFKEELIKILKEIEFYEKY